MTQPNDPTEALPTRAGYDDPPGQPGRPAGPALPAEPTVRLAPESAERPEPVEPTVHLAPPPRQPGGAEPTVHLGAGEATVHLGAGEATVHLGAGETVHLGAGEATVHLGAGEAVHLGAEEATVQLGGAEPTVRWGAAGSTGHRAGGGTPPSAGESTVDMGAAGRPGPAAWPAAAEPSHPTHPTGGATTAAGTGTLYGPRTVAATPGSTGVAGATTPGGIGATPSGRAGAAAGAPGAAAVPPGGEVRFGPGVPATPPAAPAWPAPPPRRPRSVWRTVTSVLSTLLTLALLAAVGIYLWQRISPLEITGVTVAVPEPAGDRCDVTVGVVATVRTNGRGGVIEYQWLRSGSPPSNVLTERVGRGQRSVDLTLEWTFTGVGSTRQTATVNITSPAPMQAQTEVAYDCRP
ncbi:hypothetical protein ACGFJ5_23015 [Micromonospora echinaurantiaca]|uniref:hypothetical protein n=1 Tax=Micromonospora echinaurantiaca TaxID=47857 RepID=UPI0037125807